jgi:hypothetical protein
MLRSTPSELLNIRKPLLLFFPLFLASAVSSDNGIERPAGIMNLWNESQLPERCLLIETKQYPLSRLEDFSEQARNNFWGHHTTYGVHISANYAVLDQSTEHITYYRCNDEKSTNTIQ